MTTPILFREYIWLVNTIYRAKKISLSEINDKWIETDYSGGVEFSHNWLKMNGLGRYLCLKTKKVIAFSGSITFDSL